MRSWFIVLKIKDIIKHAMPPRLYIYRISYWPKIIILKYFHYQTQTTRAVDTLYQHELTDLQVLASLTQNSILFYKIWLHA